MLFYTNLINLGLLIDYHLSSSSEKKCINEFVQLTDLLNFL